MAAVALAVALFGAACAGGGYYRGTARDVMPASLTAERGWVTVKGLELIWQKKESDCGVAALAMMMKHWSKPVTTDEILQRIPVKDKERIPAGALREFARQRGLQAFIIKGEMGDLIQEVGANRPVMVGLVQVHGDRALPHYEVVAGINVTGKRVLLFDPARGYREDGFEGFTREWEPAGRMAMVIVPS